MEIIPLKEGTFTVAQDKIFVPFDTETDRMEDRPKGSLLVEIQPFVVKTKSEILLLDTGLGLTDQQGQMQIHRLLASKGIQPEEITKVLVSHLHKDHAGGIMLPNKRVPAFENATYYINRNEWQLALSRSASYHPEDYRHLKNIHFTEGSGTIAAGITYQFTGAHSPYHQAFQIKENGNIAFFGGDVASQYMQMRTRFKAKYDDDPAAAMQQRIEWLKSAEEEGWTFMFYHDLKYPTYKFGLAFNEKGLP